MQYTVKEFRMNMRKALNDIDAGKRVTIERYGKIYQLLPTDLKEIELSGIKVVKLEPRKGLDILKQGKGGRYNGDTPIPEISNIKVNKDNTISIKDSTKLAQVVNKKIELEDIKLCNNGHIANQYGKCLQKGCKFA